MAQHGEILDPLLTRHGGAGASPLPILGFARFSGTEGEIAAARTGAALFDLSRLATLTLRGERARKALHGQVTNDILNLGPGRGCYAAHLTRKGTMLADLIVRIDAEDTLSLHLDPERTAVLLRALRPVAMLEDCELEERGARRVLLALLGPGARAALEELSGRDCKLDPFAHRELEIEDRPLVVQAWPDLGLEGYLIEAPTSSAEALTEVLLSREGVLPAGGEAFEVLRIESGAPLWGRDMGERTLPPECNIPHAISYSKGCYVGQETIARIRTYGRVAKRLMGLRPEAPLPAGTPLLDDDGREVGRITSAVPRGSDERPAALGYVRRGHDADGVRLRAAGPEGPVAVLVRELPLVPRAVPIPLPDARR